MTWLGLFHNCIWMSKHQAIYLKYIQQSNEDSEFYVAVFYVVSMAGKIQQLPLDHLFSLKHYGGNETLKKKNAAVLAHTLVFLLKRVRGQGPLLSVAYWLIRS